MEAELAVRACGARSGAVGIPASAVRGGPSTTELAQPGDLLFGRRPLFVREPHELLAARSGDGTFQAGDAVRAADGELVPCPASFSDVSGRARSPAAVGRADG